MATSVRNCAPGIFMFKYPYVDTAGADSGITESYLCASRCLGDEALLIPTPDNCSIECVSKNGASSEGLYVLQFPIEGIDLDTVGNIFSSVQDIIGKGKVICIPDICSLGFLTRDQLIEVRDGIEYFLEELKSGR